MSCLFFALSLNINRKHNRKRKRKRSTGSVVDRQFTDPMLLANEHTTSPNPALLHATSAESGAGVHFNQVQETIRYNKKKSVNAPVTKEISHDLDTITESSNEEEWQSV